MCSFRFKNIFLTDGRVCFSFENSCLAIERVRFASISNETSLSKVSLRFASITMSLAFAVFERLYIIEACAVHGGVYTTGA